MSLSYLAGLSASFTSKAVSLLDAQKSDLEIVGTTSAFDADILGTSTLDLKQAFTKIQTVVRVRYHSHLDKFV